MSYRKTILLLFLSIFLSSGRNAIAQSQSVTFTYTGAMQTWTVPSCVAYVTIDCYGAEGVGTNQENHPALGGEARGVLSVSTGQVLNIFVGGQAGRNGGGIGQNGANGGDGSDVRYPGATLADRIIVAGGGGGAGGDSWQCFTDSGNGGKGTPVGLNFMGGGGGAGYGGCGADGGSTGGTGYNLGNCHGGGGGGGGMTSGGGGATAACGPYTSGSGTLGQGGATFIAPLCNAISEGVGAGGGGYYGGGAACGYYCGGGQGGGGSSWTGTLASPFFREGHQTGNGTIVITYSSDSVGSLSAYVVASSQCYGAGIGTVAVLVNGQPGAGAFTYSWNPSGQTNDTATGLSGGTFTVTVTGCGSASTTVTLTEPAFFASNTIVNNIPCNGGQGSIYANMTGGTAPYTYMWSPEGTTGDNITGLSVGTYSLNASDSHGCKTSALLTITQPTPLVLSTALNAAVVCNGQSNGSASSSVNGGTYPYSYVWSPSGLTTASINNVPSANYTLTLTDANGCVETSTVDVNQPAPLDVIAAPLLNLACNGDNNGVLGSGVTGGTRPYTYAWSTGGVDSNTSNLSAGTYSLTVTDAHRCVTNVANTITQPAPLAITMDSTGDGGNCTGSAWVTLSGGTTPYNYMWSNGNTTFYSDGLCHGKYCCTVTDANGCIIDVCADVYSDLGVANISADAGKITVYPNPTSGQFTLMSAASNVASAVEVYNVLGEKVYTTNIAANNGGATTINISGQPSGMYLYRVISNDNGSLLGEGKVILQK